MKYLIHYSLWKVSKYIFFLTSSYENSLETLPLTFQIQYLRFKKRYAKSRVVRGKTFEYFRSKIKFP